MEKIVQDKELGVIVIRTSPRATRYSLKISKGKITATMPVGGDESLLLTFIEKNRPRLTKALLKHPARAIISDTTVMRTATFELDVFKTDRANFYMTLENKVLRIACPQEVDFEDEAIQKTLKSMLEKALRHEARRTLPQRLQELASLHKLNYSGLKINNSKTHWGSCTQRKSINLSLSLMLLPWHLIDYVLLHELCHTVEMNHGAYFWALMGKVTDGKHLELREELKSHHLL